MMTCSVCGDGGDPKGLSGVRIVRVMRLGLDMVCVRCAKEAIAKYPPTPADSIDRKRKLANARRRARYQAMRDLGMIKTPYGWE
jgi:hypothetical protein